MSERWRPTPEWGSEQPRAIHCWACESVLAFRGAGGELLLDADAEQRVEDEHRILTCGCGQRTVLPAMTTEPRETSRRTMVEQQALEPERPVKTHDYRYEYRGYWQAGGACRLRIFEADGKPPVVIATELDENTNTSITNLAEYLAAEVIARHFPDRFEHDQPITWVEQYPRSAEQRRRRVPEYSLVTFDSYTPRAVYLGGARRVRLGQPQWQHLDDEALGRLVGWPIPGE